MGNASTVRGPVRIIRISDSAWALAVAAAARTTGDRAQPYQPPVAETELSTEARLSAWAELRSAGIADGDHIIDSWIGAIGLVLAPDTLIRLTTSHRGFSSQSELSITGDRGICVHRRRTVDALPGTTRITGREPAVEISLFDATRFWGTAARVLPPLDEIRANAASADRVLGEEPVVISPELSDALTSRLQSNQDDDGGLGAALSGLDTPKELTDVVVQQTASVTAAVLTHNGGRTLAWAGMWTVANQLLYSIGTHLSENAVTITRVQPGHIARELSFALAGAYEFVATAARDDRR